MSFFSPIKKRKSEFIDIHFSKEEQMKSQTLSKVKRMHKKITEISIGIMVGVGLFLSSNTLHSQNLSDFESLRQNAPVEKVAIKKSSKNVLSKSKYEWVIESLLKKTRRSFSKALKCKNKIFESIKKSPEEYSRFLGKKVFCANFPNKILLTSFNIYSYNKDLVDLQLFNDQIISLNLPKFEFSIKRSPEAFRVRLLENEENYKVVRGPIDNAELSDFVTSRGFDDYTEFYLFIAPKRAVLKIFIRDAVTHDLKWQESFSILFSQIFVNVDVGLRFDANLVKPFTALFSSFYFHLNGFGDLGAFVSLGFYSIKNEILNAEISSNIHLSLSVGGNISFRLVETILQKRTCCDFVIYALPAIFFDIPIAETFISDTGVVEQSTLTETKTIIPVGAKVIVENFYFGGDYDFSRNVISAMAGYTF